MSESRARGSEVMYDVRFAWRQLLRTPVFTVGVVATLALGLGVSATVFSLLDGIFLRAPAGIQAPAQLRRLWIIDHDTPDGSAWARSGIDYPAFRAAAEVAPAGSAALYYATPNAAVRDGITTREANVVYATSSFLPLLGVRPAVGRLFTAAEDRLGAAAPVMVVSDAFWRRALGARPDVVGTHLRIGSATYTIVGVAPRAFAGVDLDAADLWVPFGGYPAASIDGVPWWNSTNYSGFQMVLRLPGGVDETLIAQRATQALRRAAARPDKVDSTTTAALGSIIAARGPGRLDTEVAIAIRAGGLAALLLLIVYANVLNLMLARALRRRREIAVRLALGVGRGRLARLFLAESVLLAAVAGAATLVVVTWGGGILRALLFPDLHWAGSPVDWHVALFTGLAAFVMAVLAGVIPVRHARPDSLGRALRADTRTGGAASGRLRAAMVAGQAALSTVLFVGAALFLHSLRNVERLDLGYDVDHLLFASVRSAGLYNETSMMSRLAALAGEAAGIPGVTSVARTSRTPMEVGGFGIPWFMGADSMGSRPHFRPTVTRVTPGYFAAAGMRLLAGNDLGTGQQRGVVVNATMARALWPNANPLGRCIRLGSRAHGCHVVVGVVQDAKRSTVTEAPQPQYYVAADDSEDDGMPAADILALRVQPTQIGAVAATLQRTLQTAFPNARVRVTPLRQNVDAEYRPWRLGAELFSLFGALALVIASIGVYSTVSYDVGQQTRTFGIRVALGAQSRHIVAQVLQSALVPVAVGVVLGCAIVLGAGRLIATLLYGITPADPATLVGAALLLVTLAAMAALGPAWRAARADPTVSLRAE